MGVLSSCLHMKFFGTMRKPHGAAISRNPAPVLAFQGAGPALARCSPIYRMLRRSSNMLDS